MSLSLERLRADGVLLPVGLNLAGMDLTRDDYEALGFMLGAMHETLKWAIGDYLREGERRYGEEAYQLQEALGISAESKKQYVRVAERIPLPRRRPELSWSHHRSVSALEPAEQDSWLERAIQNDWSRADLDAHRHPEEGEKTQVLVDEVIRTANQVVDTAEVNGEGYKIPLEPVDELREALGRGDGF